MKIIFLLIFITSLSFSVAVDKKWFDKPYEELHNMYEKQLNEISLNSNNLEKEQVNYQKLLLKKLQNILYSKIQNPNIRIDKIIDTKEFVELVKIYANKNTELKQIKNKIVENTEKLSLLENQISKFENKNDISTINSQLLYALYKQENKKNKTFISEINTFLDSLKILLSQQIDNLVLSNSSKSIEETKKLEDRLQMLIKEEQKNLLLFDKENILENELQTKEIEKKLEQLQKEKITTTINLIIQKFENNLSLLKDRNSSYFDFLKEIQILSNNYKIEETNLLELFKYLSRERIGLTKTTIADTKESFFDILKFSWDEVNKPYIPIGEGTSILNILKFLLIFIIGFSAASIYRRKISNSNLKNSSPATKTMLANLGFYFLVFITFLFALNSIGIDLSSLTILVGALSVGIGFGLQNIVSNFISGIILIFEKSIQVGNIIEIENEVRGKVTQINMRSSVITTFDNIDILIPNSTLMQNNVINLTFADDVRRLHVPFGVAYGTNAKYVIKTILEELEKSDLVFIRDDENRIPKVWMTGMGASSVDFKLLVWINANVNKQGLNSSLLPDFLIFIYETLYKYNIEIPFPQLDLHIKKEDENIV